LCSRGATSIPIREQVFSIQNETFIHSRKSGWSDRETEGMPDQGLPRCPVPLQTPNLTHPNPNPPNLNSKAETHEESAVVVFRASNREVDTPQHNLARTLQRQLVAQSCAAGRTGVCNSAVRGSRKRAVYQARNPNVSGELGTCKTVRSRFWSWLWGEIPETIVSCSLFAR
jgi:hypothetical protein